ncbi:MAG: hypothetical protein LBD71_02645, partial [Treponema sp.]|nr:hypothetical protein [Treponema sp.]
MKRMGFLFLALALLASAVYAGPGKDSGSGNSIEQWNGFDPATSGDGVSYKEKYAEYEKAHPGIDRK